MSRVGKVAAETYMYLMDMVMRNNVDSICEQRSRYRRKNLGRRHQFDKQITSGKQLTLDIMATLSVSVLA